MNLLAKGLCMALVAASVPGAWTRPADAAKPMCEGDGSGTRTLISVSSEEALGDRDSGYPAWPSPSWSGRYVAFMSEATNLVDGPHGATWDVFLRDVVTGTTELVSLTNAGEPFVYGASEPSISGNGRYVAFVSPLAHQDGRHGDALYLRDTLRNETTLISKRIGGGKASGSVRADVSRDGSAVVFDSGSPRLVLRDTNGRRDVFVWDRDTRQTTRVSVDSEGQQSRAASWEASISANGRYVAYQSTATDLDEGGEVGGRDYDVFLYDRISRITTRISVTANGRQGNGSSMRPSLSAGGKYVLFDSWASNLVAGDLNSSRDVFRLNRHNGAIRRASINSNHVEADGDSRTVGDGITGNGRYVVFDSNAFNLTDPEQPFAWTNAYHHDFRTGLTTVVSASPDSADAGLSSGASTISGDGCVIAYVSSTSTQVSGDTNNHSDVFLYRH